MKRYTFLFLSLLIALSMVLAACQPAVETPDVEEPTPVVVEPEPEPTDEPEPEPVTFDELVAMAEESAAEAAASAEAAAAAAAQAPEDAAAVAELVAGYEPVEYPEVELDAVPAGTEDLFSFPSVPASARRGAWPDEVILLEEPSTDAAVSRLEVGEIDIYAYTVTDPEAIARVEASDAIDTYFSSGSYNELTFNPVGPVFDNGNLNPFAVSAIRAAMNHLIDREFLVAELLAGAGTPRWTAFNSAAADSALLAAEIRAIEVQYAYDKELAAELIGAEMEALGAEMVNGTWNYNGEPVEIRLLIRIEDERLDIGDYVANQLEDIGFATFRDYKSSADASPIWISGNPADGLFHIYTGGWITTVVPRNLVDNFAFFYTDMGLPFPLWQAYDPTPEFYDVAQRLDVSDFATLEERRELAAQALDLSMQDSIRVWLYDQGSLTPKLTDISVGSDLYGAVAGSFIWAQTVHRVGADGNPEAGGTITIAMPSLLTEPWNPIAGTNWIYDMMPVRGSGDQALMSDPFTGLLWPQRAASATLVLEEGTPINHSLDWLDLSFAEQIIVPGDSWANWDAVAQEFITVADYYPMLIEALPAASEADVAAAEAAAADAAAAADDAAAAADDAAAAADVDAAQAAVDAAAEAAAAAADAEGVATGAAGRIAARIGEFETYTDILANGLTTKRVSTIVYPTNLNQVLWHDGSNFSVGDILMGMILTFDRAKSESVAFDPAAVPAFNSFMSAFKGVRIIETNPLTIETYSDNVQPDAENSVTTWWPYYAQGQGAWHQLYLGVLAEAEGLAAFSSAKADGNEWVWLNYLAGEAVDILSGRLDAWAAEAMMPYEPTFSQFVTPAEVDARIANIGDFYGEYGHFWVGTGPFFVEAAFPIEGSLQMTRFDGYIDPASKWLGFAEAAIADLAMDGEARVTIGEEAVFDLTVTFEGEPYASENIDNVQYIVLNANNEVAFEGLAVEVTEGQWQIVLTEEMTAELVPGANSLEVVVVSRLVAVPTSGSFAFVTVD